VGCSAEGRVGGLVFMFLVSSTPWWAEQYLHCDSEFASFQGFICDLLSLCSCISSAAQKLCWNQSNPVLLLSPRVKLYWISFLESNGLRWAQPFPWRNLRNFHCFLYTRPLLTKL